MAGVLERKFPAPEFYDVESLPADLEVDAVSSGFPSPGDPRVTSNPPSRQEMVHNFLAVKEPRRVAARSRASPSRVDPSLRVDRASVAARWSSNTLVRFSPPHAGSSSQNGLLVSWLMATAAEEE